MPQPTEHGGTEESAYSVLLLYPKCLNDEANDTFYAHVVAFNVYDAAAKARIQAVECQSSEGEDGENRISPADFAVLLVIKGDHDDYSVYVNHVLAHGPFTGMLKDAPEGIEPQNNIWLR